MGSLIAQQVYGAITIPNWEAGTWRSIGELFREGRTSPENHGSPYVPMDSWVYPAFDRLAAFGLLDSEFAGDRPWTRRECARLLGETEERGEATTRIATQEHYYGTGARISSRNGTARGERWRSVSLESLYSRTEYISGLPLRDGYHFAQTQINDFGRPYGQGWNTVNGFSTYST